MSEQACETPMSDHVTRFWELLSDEHVRILIDVRRDHDEGQPPHWDSASFPNDVAKAIVADIDDISYRFSCLLDHATGGRMSKVYYTKEAMYAEVDDHINRCADDLHDDIVQECIDQQPSTAENPNEDAYQRGRFDGIMEFARALQELKNDQGDPRTPAHGVAS